MQDSLIALLRPAIALTATRADDREIPLGASKFGGAPDVPAGFVWPTWNQRPLGFLAQINLEEVAPFDVESLLPKSGLLSFFHFLSDADFQPDNSPEQIGSWRAFYFSITSLSAAFVPEGSQGDYPIATAKISCSMKLTVPAHLYGNSYPKSDDFHMDDLTQWQNWEKASYHLQPHGQQHQLLGNPREVQDDARAEVAGITGRGDWLDWHLLFQIDADEENLDFMWGNFGAIFFLIHKDELFAQDFSKVWSIVDEFQIRT